VTKWESAADLILPTLRDCPWGFARLQLLLAAREFCERSGAMRVTLDPIKTIAGIADYDTSALKHTSVIKVNTATYNGVPLTRLTQSDYEQRIARSMDPGVPAFVIFDEGSVILYPTPGEAGVEVDISVTLKPSLKSNGLQSEFWEQYIEKIVLRARARCHEAIDKPYSNVDKAALLNEEFARQCGTVNLLVATTRTDAELKTVAYYE
jgi:hypothetical protein